jgi:hypothetical protein
MDSGLEGAEVMREFGVVVGADTWWDGTTECGWMTLQRGKGVLNVLTRTPSQISAAHAISRRSQIPRGVRGSCTAEI